MTQIGEPIAVPGGGGGGSEKCIFCQKDHQDDKPAAAHKFTRDMNKLKKEGREQTIAMGRGGRYPSEEKPPLVEWSKELKTGGYKAAAHHCIALKTASSHAISGELNEAGYDPNEGSNCIWLPYSRLQFIRARAHSKPLQKHRGGHTNQYFKTVEKHIDRVSDNIAKKFCTEKEKAPKERVLRFIKNEEKQIWMAVAAAFDVAYHLYNTSFLDPSLPWGSYDEEAGKRQSDYLGTPLSPQVIASDESAGAESAEDPE